MKGACFWELTVLTKYMCSVRESSHTLSLTAAVAIHTLQYFSWRHAQPLSIYRLDACEVLKLSLTACSSFTGRGFILTVTLVN